MFGSSPNGGRRAGWRTRRSFGFGRKLLSCSDLAASAGDGQEMRHGGRRTLPGGRRYSESFAPRQLLLRTALVSKLLSLSSPLSSLPAGMPFGSRRVFFRGGGMPRFRAPGWFWPN